MSLEKVLSISGKPGLYKLKTQTRGGFLAESLLDGKTINVSGRHNVSLLSEIAIYTLTEEVPLRKVFEKISEKEGGKETMSHKASKEELEEFFFGIMPDYDEDRVYASDIKKVVQWYNMLIKEGITDFSETKEENGDDELEAKAAKSGKVVSPKSAAPKTANPKASSTKKGGSTKNAASRKT
ncbi:DUF5606 domain-containing protein [Aequorivita lipolytica]|uniref:Uncharacterized protein n=1 Tax=Aequorivita lipolytica TaxID=153267 RepID=A0A5C6YNF4_9FLAO|nr:DUF5606 domain-containing protein [Aequorivita lipolytica]TXD68837.1 hypothetical protein ESV24_10310 [Aequorivita lipolytica]SRX52095.1 hypothetical protein AEQU2_02074 [Aequorivita lipolytica]